VREEEAELRREVDRTYEGVRLSLARAWSAAKALADALLEEEELDGRAIDVAIGAAGDSARSGDRRWRK
jgi:hypothetical protein